MSVHLCGYRYALLAAHGFTFDLHVNPHQLSAAAVFLADFPGTLVVLDHLGCPRCVREQLGS